MSDYKELIEALHLMEPSKDSSINDARALALKYLRSKAPIPAALLTRLERTTKKTVVKGGKTLSQDASYCRETALL